MRRMTTYVHIWKTAESESHVEYSFSPEDGAVGVMRIEMVAGKMDLLQPCPGDELQTFFQCTCKAVFKHWLEGTMPETTRYIYEG